VHFLVEFCHNNAGGHSWNGNLFGCADSVHLGVGKFDLPCVFIVDKLVPVHEVNADDVVIQLVDHIHWVSEFSSFDPEVHLIDPYGVLCIS